MYFIHIKKYVTNHKRPLLILILCIILSIAFIIYKKSYLQREIFVIEQNGDKELINHLELQPDRIVPDAISIHVGEYIQFDSIDATEHQIGLGGGDEYGQLHEHVAPEFESEVFGAKEAYRVKVKKQGVYDFHDHKNPNLFVTVIAY